jgi:Divergent InlB B-repeat domain
VIGLQVILNLESSTRSPAVRRWIVFGLVLICCLLPVSFGYAATYDLTGQCTISNTGYHNTCGISNEGNNSSTAILAQQGDTLIVVDLNQVVTVTGTISGATYTVNATYCRMVNNVDYCAPLTCTLTATSNSTASGTCSWKYSDACSGGWNMAITKQSQSAPTYDASGLWTYAQQSDQWTHCSGTAPRPMSGTLTVTQNGNRVTAVDNIARQFDGFVSGSTYTVVHSSPENGGITSEVDTVTLASGGKSATGTSHWVWTGGDESCDGGGSLTLQRAPLTVTASAGSGGGISPLGSVSVAYGGSQTFTITPNSGYRVKDVRVDGVSVGAVKSYTFDNVQGAHTIEALFENSAIVPWLQLLLSD